MNGKPKESQSVFDDKEYFRVKHLEFPALNNVECF